MIASTFKAFASVAALSGLLLSDCRDKDKPQPTGLVPDAAAVTTTTAPAQAQVTDVSQCGGCQTTTTVPTWSFEGIYRDATCTDPVAQTVTPSCGTVPAPGATSVTYVDAVGGRKAGESANVTLKELVAAEAPRFRKTDKGCVKANEAGTPITPPTCAGNRVCRDANGMLTCTACRTFGNGCPDFEETRTYAVVDDPVAFGAKKTGGGGNANLARCCAAIAAEAKRLGSSPEAGLLTQVAAQCSALAAQAGPNANAPEIAAVKAMLQGRPVPPVCAGL